jgi:hypothetical protein
MRSRKGIATETEFVVPPSRFNSERYIAQRLRHVPEAVRGSVRTALGYLYLHDGPRNLPADRKRAAEPYLETAERILVRWLHPRTNGQYRKTYGFPALACARRAAYRCERCGFGDVRTLELDHVDGRAKASRFACLCANCHRIKSRVGDWKGRAVASSPRSGRVGR